MEAARLLEQSRIYVAEDYSSDRDIWNLRYSGRVIVVFWSEHCPGRPSMFVDGADGLVARSDSYHLNVPTEEKDA